MKSTIWFIYSDNPATSFDIEGKPEEIAREIKYWLGKSPGIHDVVEILVVAKESSWLRVLREVEEERADFRFKQIEAEERRTYERLREKFGTDKSPP